MTHVIFDQDSIDWSQYLSRQQVGQGMVMSGRGDSEDVNKQIFRGTRYVRGYGSIKGVLGSIGRFLLPIASNIAGTAKEEAQQSLGRLGADIVQGKPLLGSIKQQTQEGLSNIGKKLQQCGKGKRKHSKKPSEKNRDILKDISTYEINNNQGLRGTKTRKRRGDYLDI
jgi:hypothetical protein